MHLPFWLHFMGHSGGPLFFAPAIAAPRSTRFTFLGASVGVSPAAPGIAIPQFRPSNPMLHSHWPSLQTPLPEQSLRHRCNSHFSPKYFSLQRQVPIKQWPRPRQFSGHGWMSHASPVQPPEHAQTPALQVPWAEQSLKHVGGCNAPAGAAAGAGDGAGAASLVRFMLLR